MPGRLELDEVADLVTALRLLTGPIDLVIALSCAHTLDTLGRAELELLLFFLTHDGVDAADVRVGRESGNEFLPLNPAETTTPPEDRNSGSSPRTIAGYGNSCDARQTQVLPAMTTGAIWLRSPSSGKASSAIMPMIPIGSATVKLKNGPATGLVLPSTCSYLSDHPA